MYEDFTNPAREVMALANREAQRFNLEFVATEDILMGLILEGNGAAANILKNLDVDILRKVRVEIEKLKASSLKTVAVSWLPLVPRANRIIERAREECRELQHSSVGTEHLLLGLVRDPDTTAAQLLMNLSLKLEEIRQAVLSLLGHAQER